MCPLPRLICQVTFSECAHTCGRISSTNKKSGAPVDMRSLLVSLKAIEHVCSQDRSKKSNPSRNEKALHSEKKGTKQPGTEKSARVPKKACAEKHCNLCKKHGGTYTTHNTSDCRRLRKMEHKNLISLPLRKAERNPIPQSSLLCS